MPNLPLRTIPLPPVPFADRLAGPARIAVGLARLPLKVVPMAVHVVRQGVSTVAGLAGSDQELAPPPVGPTLPTPVVLPDSLKAEVAELPEGSDLSHGDLPLADYDHMTLGSLRARVAKLAAPEIVQLLDYERAHANRLPVVLLFENRLRKIGAAVPEPIGS